MVEWKEGHAEVVASARSTIFLFDLLYVSKKCILAYHQRTENLSLEVDILIIGSNFRYFNPTKEETKCFVEVVSSTSTEGTRRCVPGPHLAVFGIHKFVHLNHLRPLKG